MRPRVAGSMLAVHGKGRVVGLGALIGDLLPLSVGVAISPVPIIAVILMLLSKRAGSTSVGFAIGWVLGIAVAP